MSVLIGSILFRGGPADVIRVYAGSVAASVGAMGFREGGRTMLVDANEPRGVSSSVGGTLNPRARVSAAGGKRPIDAIVRIGRKGQIVELLNFAAFRRHIALQFGKTLALAGGPVNVC